METGLRIRTPRSWKTTREECLKTMLPAQWEHHQRRGLRVVQRKRETIWSQRSHMIRKETARTLPSLRTKSIYRMLFP